MAPFILKNKNKDVKSILKTISTFKLKLFPNNREQRSNSGIGRERKIKPWATWGCGKGLTGCKLWG